MCLRIAVRQVEAWLLADAARIARFIGVSRVLVPNDPDAVPNAKDAMVNLARRSTRRAIRDDMVPVPGSGLNVGPGYSGRLIEFALDERNGWRPEEADGVSPSLHRARLALEVLIRSQPNT
jgi:hypothetical protein